MPIFDIRSQYMFSPTVCTEEVLTGECLVAATLGTLAGERCFRPVKQRRLCGIFVPSGVAIVGLGALVAALITKSLLIRPSKVSVPGKKISRDAKCWFATSVLASHVVRDGYLTGY
jgi:hypothetical protein